MTVEVMSGNYAQSYAAKLARVDVIAAYPITPQTSIVEKLAQFVASGELKAKYVPVESEHSALQTVLSASGMGARTYTATSGQGLLLMHELLHWATGVRAPIVMGVVNRAVAAPWNIGADHADTISQRDTGWLQFYAESNQEVLDTVLQAFRLAEDPEIRLPVMINEDAFYLSHTVEPVDLPDQAAVDRFLPRRRPVAVLVPGTTGRLGSFTGPEDHVRFRREMSKATDRVPKVFSVVEEEFRRLIGRDYGGALPLYKTDDADAILLTMGTIATTARTVVDELRSEGRKVGLARIRQFRPFPADELRALAARVDRIGVVDRSFTFGGLGATAVETRSALYPSPHRPMVGNFLAGVGGRDVTPTEVRAIFDTLLGSHVPEVEWSDLKAEEEVVHG
ncbi:MAG TPA: transketolase C-terminal domain-containing protein [Thermoplasmata archaeon]|nr:transketolase C-terminal domain-containing protein [Thermoplasmata archaeon]